MPNALYQEWFFKEIIEKARQTGDIDAAFSDFMHAHAGDSQVEGFLESLQKQWPSLFDKLWNNYVLNQVGNGEMGLNDAYSEFSQYGVSPNEETSKYLDNLISQSNTASDRQFQQEMRDTSLISSGNQLNQLGLSPSNVIQVGGAASGLSSAAAAVSHGPTSANRKQQLAMNQYNQRLGMAKSLISMAGSMASSGIYGHALGAAKHSASVMGAAASHSGLRALQSLNTSKGDPNWSNNWDSMLKNLGY